MRPAGAALVAVALTVLAAGCSDDDSVAGTGGPTGVVTSGAPEPESSQECSSAIPDEAMQAFGWSVEEPARGSAGRCERASGTDQVSVTDRAGEDLDEACDALAAEAAAAGVEPDLDATWLSPAGGCYRGFPDGSSTGFAEAVLLTEDDRVVQLLVSSTGEGTDDLQGGLLLLADAARG